MIEKDTQKQTPKWKSWTSAAIASASVFAVLFAANSYHPAAAVALALAIIVSGIIALKSL